MYLFYFFSCQIALTSNTSTMLALSFKISPQLFFLYALNTYTYLKLYLVSFHTWHNSFCISSSAYFLQSVFYTSPFHSIYSSISFTLLSVSMVLIRLMWWNKEICILLELYMVVELLSTTFYQNVIISLFQESPISFFFLYLSTLVLIHLFFIIFLCWCALRKWHFLHSIVPTGVF